MNRKKIDRFWKERTKIKDPRVATHFKHDDTHVYDLRLIKKLIKPDTEVLDLACGTCYISNQFVDQVRYIKAVDKFPQFLKRCKKTPKMETVTCDILTFTDRKKYDLILLIGIMLFFDYQDSEIIYRKCHALLNKGGIMLARHQCGVKKDVVVDKYSQTVGGNYYAQYKHFDKELQMLEKIFKKVTVVDVLPKHLNPWPDTHHYAFICKKT
ncbi:MAG TPA: class I SAM-dependent methyltransferase [Patescibacteria group bacterium]|nr:class I SAM-dependent methyltransferase [Patescibacteria group bacterium]